jgi:hypothetical protein
MRTLLAHLGTVVAILIGAAPAAADPPVQQTATITVTNPIKINQSCRPYGYDFDLLATFTVTRRSTLSYDDAGALAKEIRHINFNGTLYRSTDLTRTIPYAGRWQRTLDVVAETVAITGLWLYSHPDGSGVTTLAAGRQITDAETGELLSATGRVPSAALQDVCAHLAS